jgi:hypothetical protein
MKILIAERKLSNIIQKFVDNNVESDSNCKIEVTEEGEDIWLTVFLDEKIDKNFKFHVIGVYLKNRIEEFFGITPRFAVRFMDCKKSID